MAKSLRIPFLTLSAIFYFCSASLGQEQKGQPVITHEAKPQKYVLSPDDVQKRQSVQPKVVTTIQPEKAPLEKEEDPEERAVRLLNTSIIPDDFPRYRKSEHTTMEYETLVADYFRKNPDKRKQNPK